MHENIKKGNVFNSWGAPFLELGGTGLEEVINVKALDVKQKHQKTKEQLGMALWGRASSDAAEQGFVVCLVGSSTESQTQAEV